MLNDLEKKIEDVALNIVHEAGFELFEVSVRPYGNKLIIEIIVDFPRGGISLGECASVNKLIGRELDELNVIDKEYTLEVNSPGLDRQLKGLKDYLRVVGKLIHLYLKEIVEGKLEHVGKLIEANEYEIVIEVKEQKINILITNIQKALQEIDL